MIGLNRVQLLGNVGKDPNYGTTASGESFISFSIAVNSRGKDGTDYTEWVDCTSWGKLSEVMVDKIKKGTRVYLEGRLNKRTADDGRVYVNVVVNNFEAIPSTKELSFEEEI